MKDERWGWYAMVLEAVAVGLVLLGVQWLTVFFGLMFLLGPLMLPLHEDREFRSTGEAWLINGS